MNKLWFGDNLMILREEIADESVDLIYLDPPFNSNANYNVLFRTPDDEAASAQVEAFRDTWTWGDEAQWSFDEIMRAGGPVAAIVRALHSALGHSDMMAYLAMMAERLTHLHRVLRETGSFYLHCDPTASHYLKVILDAVFGARRFVNEIPWKRSHAHSDSRQGAKHYGRIHDVLLFYSKSDQRRWNTQFTPYSQEYVDRDYRRVDPCGRRYRLDNIQGPGGAAKGNPFYEVMGVSRHWRYSKERMSKLIEDGRIVQVSPGSVPQIKRYLDEMPGVPVQDVWTDIKLLNNRDREKLGYPTQKPVSLLDRVIRTSSNPGDLILDPFCGCGTTIAAAEASGRHWIGIDIAYHAIKVIEDRLGSMPNVAYDLGGIPRDFEGAVRLADRDKYQFQWWGNYLIGVQALKEVKKGRDRGIDGQMFFMNGPRGWGRILTSVKGGQNVGVKDIREFRAVLDREAAEMGVFICLRRPTRDMASEAASFGFVQTAHGHLPRLQIVSIEEWFQGARPSLPSLGHVTREAFQPQGKTKARRVNPNAPEFTFTFPGGKTAAEVVHFNPATVRTAPAQSALL